MSTRVTCGLGHELWAHVKRSPWTGKLPSFRCSQGCFTTRTHLVNNQLCDGFFQLFQKPSKLYLSSKLSSKKKKKLSSDATPSMKLFLNPSWIWSPLLNPCTTVHTVTWCFHSAFPYITCILLSEIQFLYSRDLVNPIVPSSYVIHDRHLIHVCWRCNEWIRGMDA